MLPGIWRAECRPASRSPANGVGRGRVARESRCRRYGWVVSGVVDPAALLIGRNSFPAISIFSAAIGNVDQGRAGLLARRRDFLGPEAQHDNRLSSASTRPLS